MADKDNDAFWRVALKNVGARGLNASSRSMVCVPPEIARFSLVAKLNLSHNRLSTLPQEIAALKKLEELHLGNNELSALPSGLGLLPLHVLYLFNNKLVILDPLVVSKLTSLTVLSLNNNMLSSLPDEIGCLTNLHTLMADSNRLTALPSTIGNMSSLVKLSLRANMLASLPSAIASLPRIEEVVLIDNRFRRVPSHLARCASLRLLDVSLNYITVLDEWVLHASSIKKLFIDGNPLQSPSAPVGPRLPIINSLKEIALRRVALLAWSGFEHVVSRLAPETVEMLKRSRKCASCGGIMVLEWLEAVRFQPPPPHCLAATRATAVPVLLYLCSVTCLKKDPHYHVLAD